VSRRRPVYPFSAIVGQERMKKALLLNAINPGIGGVLLRGEKGTAKSLAVRALAELLPRIKVVARCPFNCDPDVPEELCELCASGLARGERLEFVKRQIAVVELPLGATEDRVVGTLDIERAIKGGEKHFEPGILAAANRGILYIDEVNLLNDHLVDVLLDAAAMGINYVEREGISFSHPARFILVGTMNPEEGELRPQLLDRFGLSVEVKGIDQKEARMEIVRRRTAFEENPVGFVSAWEKEQEELRAQIKRAKELLSEVKLGEEMLDLIAEICLDFRVDGHRADIVMHKTALTLAAFYGRREVTEGDVKEAAELVLPHRHRRQPFEEPGLDQKQLEDSIQNWQRQKRSESSSGEEEQGGPPSFENLEGKGREQTFEATPPSRVKPFSTPASDELPRKGVGRRSRSKSSSGRYVGSAIPRGKVRDLAFDATLRAAAPFQVRRKGQTTERQAFLIEKCDLREKVKEKRVGNLILFVIDASGSMAAEERMKAAKGAVLSLLLDAYQKRDQVGMVVFRGEKAELVLPPTRSAELARKRLEDIPTGGRTPLAHGLLLGLQTIKNERQKDKTLLPLLVLVSDGKANVSLNRGDPVEEAKDVARRIREAGIKTLALDTEQGWVSLGLVPKICQEMGGVYLKLEELEAGSLLEVVKTERISKH